PQAVSGPGRIGELATFFEAGGVPFHSWCVVKGRDPRREAAMAAEALGRGARSLILDLEPHSGFWEGTAADAVAYGRELRRLQPDAWIIASIDPRPWLLPRMPLREFAAFADAWAPLIYWESFSTEPNVERLVAGGTPPGTDGVTPRFLLDMTALLLAPYRLPILPIGQGGSTGAHWTSFVGRAFDHGMEAVSVWRYGVTKPEVWQFLRENPPLPKEEIYVVQSGDTLTGIAQRHESSVSAIAEHNGIENPNFLRIGQELRIPRGRRRSGGGSSPAPAPAAAPTPVSGPGRRATYEVQPGDTLHGLARRWQSSIAAIADANGLGNPDLIHVGQRLLIP
ncbi:MAG: LysM peptidoglycan-binding domain-containing protein, partial [Chloroflexi bacterium]|nr:LysM peptidoglycan-binding domain-containing protein [Chloroflexota bacterium]